MLLEEQKGKNREEGRIFMRMLGKKIQAGEPTSSGRRF